MSLLGKKRIQREEEDDNVRYNHIITNNILYIKEYNQMFGIKDPDPPEDEGTDEKKNIISPGQKIESKEIKIIEMKITISNKEKIKQKSVRKENKIKIMEKEKEKEKVKISIFPISSDKNEFKKKLEEKIKNESKMVNKKNDSNILAGKPMDNPFQILLKKNNNNSDKEQKNESNNTNKKTNDKPTFSLFGNIKDNEKETKGVTNTQKSLFGNFGNDINNKETKTNNNSLFSNNTSLFSGTNQNNNMSLFSGNNNSNNNNNNSLFSSNNNTPLFSLGTKNNNNTNNKSLFGENNGKSLFGGNNGKSLFSGNSNVTPFLFSNNNTNPFSQIKGESFLNSLNNNKNNTNSNDNTNKETLFDDNPKDDNDEDDERDKPKTKYVSEPLKAQDYSDYSKLYNTHLNNLFIYNKTEKKYISKGNGFFSIEKTKDENNKQHQAVIVFRNQTGNKLVEGFIDKKIKKFDIYNKNFNYVVCLSIIRMVKENPEISYIKIPFKNEEDANKLKEAFNKAISFIEQK